MVPTRVSVAALLLVLASIITAHGDDEHTSMDMGAGMNMSMGGKSNTTMPLDPERNYNQYDVPSYSGLDVHTGLLLAHVVFVVLAWVFVLPIGE